MNEIIRRIRLEGCKVYSLDDNVHLAFIESYDGHFGALVHLEGFLAQRFGNDFINHLEDVFSWIHWDMSCWQEFLRYSTSCHADVFAANH